jgi:hypothetical protein
MADTLHKGIEWRRLLTSVDDDTGDASDLSGMTGADITVEIRRVSSGANLLTYTIGSGITLVSGGSGGVARLIVPAVDSVGLASANHVWRVLIEEQVARDWQKLTVRD